MVVFPNVKLVKFPKLDEIDSALVGKALEHFFRKVGDNAELVLSMKEYAKGGLRVQHELHGKLIINGKSFFAEDTGWQLLEVVQSVLKALEKEFSKAFSR